MSRLVEKLSDTGEVSKIPKLEQTETLLQNTRHATKPACLVFFGFECYFFVRKNDLSQEDI
ncbi:MAG: hypothetical protein A2131_00990 [Candidatus Sungbacteria bacterium GWC2_49_10]|uniref:Uncharacterized protein n=2 Tax=Parcubacteria group TaxID=1794811 RepID=A0A0G1ZK97_9BACT|nr:MAG: hypothetical protein UY61_C0049G0011 [Candidatus Adlerbacteria bacterium GW2011_GWC1_50_9]OGZ94216.1 MAG: hypothetical protein A2131_00990 [Candidatus Sungbacteria bacterium GWC2_49_10]